MENELINSLSEEDENIIESSDINLDSFERAIVLPMDLSVELISTWSITKKLDINPSFQRRVVWDEVRMSLFIESLILNVPIPSILLANDERSNKFLVIDGKQRLSAILRFVAPDNDGKGFKLKGLKVLNELNGYTYKKLAEDTSKENYFTRIENALLKTNVVKKYDDCLLYFIFSRLNNGSVALSTQELRQSLYPGQFTDFVNEYSMISPGIKRVLNLKSLDKRMRDAELLVRYYAFKYYKDSYEGKINEFFNSTCEKLNKDWAEKSIKIKEDAKEMEKSIEFIYQKFGDDAFRVYFVKEDEEYFGPFNRPMFDLMTTIFSSQSNRDKINVNNFDLKAFTINLFKTNKIFAEAFLPTTHSKEKTATRFNEYLNALSL